MQEAVHIKSSKTRQQIFKQYIRMVLYQYVTITNYYTMFIATALYRQLKCKYADIKHDPPYTVSLLVQ